MTNRDKYDWEQEFKKWKAEKKKKLAKIEKPIEVAEEKIEEVLEETLEKIENPVNRKWIVLGSIALVIVAILVISFVANPPVESKFKDVDVDVRNTTGVPMNIYYKNSNVFSLSGWESKLEYGEKEDRLFGKENYREIVFDEKGKGYTVISTSNGIVLEPLTTDPNEVTRIGWFSKLEDVQIDEEESWGVKEVNVLTDGGNGVESVEFDYQFYRKKPYFTISFDADVEDEGKIGSFSYGLVMRNFDIYLDDGTILENDNEVIELDENKEIVLRENGTNTNNVSDTLLNNVAQTVNVNAKKTERRGSTHTVNDSRQQIFYNLEDKRVVILYADEVTEFVNSFYWNVYWIKVPHNEGFPKLYFIVFEDATLVYEGNEWRVESKEFDGYVNDYIFDMLSEIEEK